jgi:hypothetical protein
MIMLGSTDEFLPHLLSLFFYTFFWIVDDAAWIVTAWAGDD